MAFSAVSTDSSAIPPYGYKPVDIGESSRGSRLSNGGDAKCEDMPTQRDKPSNLSEKTEDMPTQRDKPSNLGV
ncbi:hypothetical protein TNCV_3006281 [Trichonephila clavipes]|nr:hypothetical protein TNCV_3006281 [Trichonephila clavipes]